MRDQKKHIIRKKQEFEEVFRHDKKIVGTHTVIYFKSNKESIFGTARLGLVVSKKNGNAVVRNKIKRWYREIFRNISSKIDPCTDMVWIAKHGTIDQGYHNIFEEIYNLLTKKKILQ